MPVRSTVQAIVKSILVRATLVLIALGVCMAPVDARTSVTGTVLATTAINIRACAALDCKVIGSARLGDTMDVTGELTNGFFPVTWYGREGFVYALYLNTPGATPPWFVEGSPDCNQVALVFNIGIGDEPSQEIVDTLIENDVPATMFPMGWWATEHPAFLRALDAAGFAIGTHGDQPLMLPSVPDDVVRTDVETSVATIEDVLGREIDQYFTPYAAESDDRVRLIVSELGLLPVGWNVSASDYGEDATEDSVYENVMDEVYPGAIIEMHLDGPATATSTALALPRIIEDLRLLGYELVTVPDLVLPCEDVRAF
jgi:peptidoglycan/xylan/chitin deacetylase (PgdA/CDA1 family)